FRRLLGYCSLVFAAIISTMKSSAARYDSLTLALQSRRVGILDSSSVEDSTLSYICLSLCLPTCSKTPLAGIFISFQLFAQPPPPPLILPPSIPHSSSYLLAPPLPFSLLLPPQTSPPALFLSPRRRHYHHLPLPWTVIVKTSHFPAFSSPIDPLPSPPPSVPRPLPCSPPDSLFIPFLHVPPPYLFPLLLFLIPLPPILPHNWF
ncbi:hypothetical protein ACH5RR_030959, partial [Cinchona calisaya]